MYIEKLKQGIDLRVAFFQLSGNSRQVVEFVMRPDIINLLKLGPQNKLTIVSVVRSAPNGTGDS